MTDSSSPSSDPSPRHLVSSWWRVLAATLLVALMVAVATGLSMLEQFRTQIAYLQSTLASAPQLRELAVLLDDAHQPALLVTHDPASGALQLQRLNAVKEGREESLQLWALADGQPPRSLGLIGSRYKTAQLPATQSTLAGVTELAVSVEDKAGAIEGRGPSLPYLFRGALVVKAI